MEIGRVHGTLGCELSCTDADDREAAQGSSEVIGKVRSLSGAVSVARIGGQLVEAEVGSNLFQGDVVATGPHGRIGIAFEDGGALNLGPHAQIELAQFGFDSDHALCSGLVKISQGRFAVGAGRMATKGGLWIDTPFATLRGSAQNGAIGIVTAVTLTLILMQELEAEIAPPFLLDDILTY